MAPGAQLAQACHIMREWSEKYPELDAEWYDKSNYLVCLSAPPEEISKLIDKCKLKEIPHVFFKEPDFGNKITGLAIAPCVESKRITSNLPLALRSIF